MMTHFCRLERHRECDTPGCQCSCHHGPGPIERGQLRWTLAGYGLSEQQADRIIDAMHNDGVEPTGAEMRRRAHEVLRSQPRQSADN